MKKTAVQWSAPMYSSNKC